MSGSDEQLQGAPGLTTGLSCAEVEDLEVAYVWGALEPAERARVDAHRRECAACDERLRASEQVVSSLDQAHPSIEPPPELRSRVLGAIASISAEHERSAGGAPRPVAPVRLAPTAHRQSVGGLRVRRVPHPRFFTSLATGALGALAAVALVIVFWQRPDAFGFVTGGQSQLGPGGSGNGSAPPGLSIPGAPPTSSSDRLIELSSSSGQGRGLLAYDTATRRGVLMLEGLPTRPGETDYGVWLVQGTQRVRLGELTIDAQGVGTFVLPSPLPLDRPERLEVVQTSPAPGAAPIVVSGKF
jgi:hypothetical protein